MKVNFNNGDKSKGVFETKMTRGGFEDMMKERQKQLPKLEATIQGVLDDYDGRNICIVIQNEDENGNPTNATILMSGVTKMESQVAMAKSLHNASESAIDVVMKGAEGDLTAMLKLASLLVDNISKEK